MRRANNYSGGRTRSGLSFENLCLIGETIAFIDDPSITALVTGDKTVEFEGTTYNLSPLTKEIQTRKGRLTSSGAYRGAAYWTYQGERLLDLME